MEAIGAAIVAVAGTLLGGVVAGWTQYRAARAQRRIALQDQALTALQHLAAALADHRRAMWMREELRLSGAPQSEIVAAREASHVTRAAITAPQVAVTMLMPTLVADTTRAVDAVYAMRGAPTMASLASLRETAIETADHLIGAAASTLMRT